MNYIIIEQAEDCEAYITPLRAKDMMDAIKKYQNQGLGELVILTEEAYGRMCQMGAGG